MQSVYQRATCCLRAHQTADFDTEFFSKVDKVNTSHFLSFEKSATIFSTIFLSIKSILFKTINSFFLVYVIIGSINAIPNGIKTTKDKSRKLKTKTENMKRKSEKKQKNMEEN